MNELLQGIAGVFMGPGAFGDPKETFKLYAPPNLLDVYSPEQQDMYGKQIQAQMRRINADYRPNYNQIQTGIVNATTAGLEREKAARARAAQLQQQRMLASIFGGPAPDSGMPAGGMPMGGDPMAGMPMGGAPTYGVVAGDEPSPVEIQPIDGNTPTDAPLREGEPVTPAAPAQTTLTRSAANPRKAQAMRYFKAAQYYAAMGDADSAKKYHEIGMNLDPNPSQEIRDLEYLGFNLAGTGQAGFNQLAKLNQSKVPGGENKAEMAYFAELGKRMPELEIQARKAAATNEQLGRLGDLNDQKTFTGILAPGAIGAAQFASSLGLDIKPETLANSREFQAAANILVLDFMGAMGGARGFSKEESAILYDAFPKIIDSPQARARIIKMLQKRNNDIITEYNSVRSNFEGAIGKKLPTPDLKPIEMGGAPAASGAPVMRFDKKLNRLVPVGQ